MASSTKEPVETDSYDVWKRAFSDTSNIDPEMLLKPIDDYESALRAHQKAHAYDANAKYKERIADLLKEYSDE